MGFFYVFTFLSEISSTPQDTTKSLVTRQSHILKHRVVLYALYIVIFLKVFHNATFCVSLFQDKTLDKKNPIHTNGISIIDSF